MNASRLAAAVVVFAVAACSGGDVQSGYHDVVASVEINVVDAQNNIVADGTASYSVNGGSVLFGSCFPTGVCLVGQGEGGRFVITISKSGYVSATVTVDVPPPSPNASNAQFVTVVLRSG